MVLRRRKKPPTLQRWQFNGQTLCHQNCWIIRHYKQYCSHRTTHTMLNLNYILSRLSAAQLLLLSLSKRHLISCNSFGFLQDNMSLYFYLLFIIVCGQSIYIDILRAYPAFVCVPVKHIKS